MFNYILFELVSEINRIKVQTVLDMSTKYEMDRLLSVNESCYTTDKEYRRLNVTYTKSDR